MYICESPTGQFMKTNDSWLLTKVENKHIIEFLANLWRPMTVDYWPRWRTSILLNFFEEKNHLSWIHCTFDQAAAAPTRSRWPRPSSSNSSGIPTTTSITTNGTTNAPETSAPGSDGIADALHNIGSRWRGSIALGGESVSESVIPSVCPWWKGWLNEMLLI